MRNEQNNKYNEYCKLLGVDQTASLKEIQDAYYKQALKTHPDKSKQASEETFIKVKEAYDYLIKNASVSVKDHLIEKNKEILQRINQQYNSLIDQLDVDPENNNPDIWQAVIRQYLYTKLPSSCACKATFWEIWEKQPENKKFFPLLLAAENNHITIAKLFLEKLSQENNVYANVAINLSIKHKNNKMVNFLLAQKIIEIDAWYKDMAKNYIESISLTYSYDSLNKKRKSENDLMNAIVTTDDFSAKRQALQKYPRLL
jgi:hypothetical protein